MGISVVLLAYKEEENLRVLLPRIIREVKRCGEAYEILVVDTKRPLDQTEEVCKQYGACYVNQEAPGFGGAFRTGIKYASMDKFLILDSDGSHPTEKIYPIYQKFVTGMYDVVIGSRYVEGGKTNDSTSSIWMSHILNGVFRLCIGVKAKDISTDFRMYHTADLKAVELNCENYDVLQEVLLKLKLQKFDQKLRVGEVPIEFQKRMFGESKRQLIRFVISYGKTLVKLTSMRVTNGGRQERRKITVTSQRQREVSNGQRMRRTVMRQKSGSQSAMI